MFGERYGIEALYTDALEMYEKENLDILAIATNTRGRSFLTVKAVEAGVKGIFVDKPMTFTLKEADDMVNACAKAGVPLVGGATTTSHPSFGKAKELITGGAIGDVRSIEARVPLLSQHQDWCYFVDSELDWVSGIGDKPRRERGSSEFMGQGIIVAKDGTVVPHSGRSPYRQNLGKHGGDRLRRQALDPVAGCGHPLGTQGAGGDALARSPVGLHAHSLVPGRPDCCHGRPPEGAQELGGAS